MEPNERFKIYRELPSHELLYELADWMEKGHPAQGWVMTLSSEEFEMLTSLEESEQVVLFSLILQFKRLPKIGDSFTRLSIEDGNRKLQVLLALEDGRRRGLVAVKEMNEDEDEWIWHATEAGKSLAKIFDLKE